ncbi:Protein HGH1-like protein [Smittium mucronatum]|uniref:Protein HGH1-like protein n=1 Tax=Smittium mucronatum TaxID=133383 RepID=A0A1R0GPG9_9FUNG|nr:Protein HGH1-like protein [Smittium mucronatum]
MEHLDELLGFLDSEREDVRTYAINYLTGFSKPGSEFYSHFVKKSSSIVPVLLVQCRAEGIISHDAIKEGRDYFLSTRVDGKQPITKIIVFSEYPDVIRRGGVISVIKNICFSYENVMQLLDPEQINILPYILLPILGNEDYDEEDSDGMPEEVQLLDEDKKRETDPQLRLYLIEALILLSVNKNSRDILREKKVYPIVRTMHLAETDSHVADAIDRLVQLIMRDEDIAESKIQEFEEI